MSTINVGLPKLHSAKCHVHGFWIGEGECQTCKRTREQRRYEIARDVMAALTGHPPGSYSSVRACANNAVAAADALLKALEESSDDH